MYFRDLEKFLLQMMKTKQMPPRKNETSFVPKLFAYMQEILTQFGYIFVKTI